MIQFSLILVQTNFFICLRLVYVFENVIVLFIVWKAKLKQRKAELRRKS